MKKYKLAARLLLFVLATGTIAFLVIAINRPVQTVAAPCDVENQELCSLTNVCDSVNCLDQCVPSAANNNCGQTACTDPDVDGCLPGCSLNSDEVCVPDDPQTPDNTPQGTPQVLGASTTATDPASTAGK